MRYLHEKGIGQEVPSGVVPIVPAAAIYDLAFWAEHYPSADDAYQACVEAVENNPAHGRIGAGSGATVGKLIPTAHCMTGGIGRASLTQADGLEVLAYVVVNCVGDVRDAGTIIAGARDEEGRFADCEQFILSGRAEIGRAHV
jgi:L-aminopeptidase/D-esterase-like protein